MKVKRRNMELELLSPAGNMEKLKTAVYFGANAVYFSGKTFGLRAFAGNFSDEEIAQAVDFCHKHNVKAYITVNIVAHEKDFTGLKEYLELLDSSKVDAIIVSDLGIMSFAKKYAPRLDIHVSTQANITNKYTAKMYADLGAKRIVLARELSLSEIKAIKDYLGDDIELEAFVHGAMCISYSGRCLLSNFLAGRSSNHGECVQACRWGYEISAKGGKGEQYPIEQDERGTYILNSKDLNMVEYIKDLAEAGVTSFKIEGRMKTAYYVATVVNAYRRAIDLYLKDEPLTNEIKNELNKASNRGYSTGLYFANDEKSVCLETSTQKQTYDFVAVVLSSDGKYITVEQRNRFKVGDELEVLSPDDNFNKVIKVTQMKNQKDEEILDAKNVQEVIKIKCPLKLHCGDILRKIKVE